MALYTIADLHLSLGVGKEKSMEVFGRRWQGYTEKLEHNWRAIIEPEDDVVIPGDISWALGIDAALEDLRFIDSLPGTKYIGKGNHDFWWSTRKKLEDFFAAHGITSIRILYNCAYEVEDYIICGTRGWFYDDNLSGIPEGTDFDKLVNREAQRLKLSLDESRSFVFCIFRRSGTILHASRSSHFCRNTAFGNATSGTSTAPMTRRPASTMRASALPSSRLII